MNWRAVLIGGGILFTVAAIMDKCNSCEREEELEERYNGCRTYQEACSKAEFEVAHLYLDELINRASYYPDTVSDYDNKTKGKEAWYRRDQASK